MGEFVDDEHFLVATYNVCIQVEQKKALEELRGKRKEGVKDKGKKNSGRDREGKPEGKGPKRFEMTSSGAKATRSGYREPGRWKSKDEALIGVPAKEKSEFSASSENCWDCGSAGHRMYECFAATTKAGTSLPTALWKGVLSIKRKRETYDPKEEEALPTTKVKTEEDDGTRDIAGV